MRPRSIRLFELSLWLALAIDLANNLAAWNAMVATLHAHGFAPNPLLLFLACIASPVVGLILWYAVARLRSSAAKWIMMILVVAGAAGFVWKLLTPPDAHRVTLIAAAVAEAIKVFAVTRLFTRDSVAWLKGARG
ncbi:hypothetical protein [Sphingomonas nostoxanthinifaciens]|uniref:hypothetical protein n=1 Tax=Sphingomonas nostoxanthinifaciens TaxID=2872652 RepID=UPI001CC2029F|nr:hypothetical protein [Sphingomonas nostoxanthinifaciens]UAK23325.1 hypothetical protein K8P63_13060 [Sphingomonas nostoxanthinifaciens]